MPKTPDTDLNAYLDKKLGKGGVRWLEPGGEITATHDPKIVVALHEFVLVQHRRPYHTAYITLRDQMEIKVFESVPDKGPLGESVGAAVVLWLKAIYYVSDVDRVKIEGEGDLIFTPGTQWRIVSPDTDPRL